MQLLILFIPFLVATFAAFVYWGTGISTTDPENPTYKIGRVFSFYGKALMHRVWVAQANDPNSVIWYYPFGLCRVCFTTHIVNATYLVFYAFYFITFENPNLSLFQYGFLFFIHTLLITFSTWVSVKLEY
jgi:hypothetical protein